MSEHEFNGVQASATTLNMTEDQAVAEGKTPHTHKANFGRIVAGCPRCMEIVVERGEAQTANVAAPTVNVQQIPAGVMTMEQVLLMIEKLREPDDETKRKREDEKRLQARREAESLELARVEMEQTKFRHANCGTAHGPHTKDNGRTAIQGQIHSDGMFHGICVRCGYQPTPTQPAVGTIVGGIQ